MLTESAIYTGTIRHRRFEPIAHEFTYPLFMTYLDIDRIPELMQVSRAASYNRWNWASYQERDHFGDSSKALRERLRIDAAAHDVTLPDGKIFLLTHLRYLGYVFNPISIYYCFNRDGHMETALAEVNSTFGETANYWLTARNQLPSTNSMRYQCGKTLHVSPFMPMELDYEFVLTTPGEKLIAHMNTISQTGDVRSNFTAGRSNFDATLTLDRQEWSAPALRRALVRFPVMTAKVIGGIHWEALKLFVKRAPFYRHPSKLKAKRKDPKHAPTSDIAR